jgi:ribosomal protein S27AE
VKEASKPDADDERPPICPACGVTMGMIVHEDGETRYVCLECGFSDERSALRESRRDRADP